MIGRIPNGQINSVNADESLLLGFVAYDSQPLQPTVPDPRNRRFDQAEYEADGPDGKPLYPQRPLKLREEAQHWTEGTFAGKMILVESLVDEARKDIADVAFTHSLPAGRLPACLPSCLV